MKSDELKEDMKESPRRYTNPFLSDEENEKVNFWNNQELYTDKNVMECDLPELLVCYKESSFHVKDICVDEGIPHGERIMFDDIIDESLDDTHFLKTDRLIFSECTPDILNGFKSTSNDVNGSSECAPDIPNESKDDSRNDDEHSECAPDILDGFKSTSKDDNGSSECTHDIANGFRSTSKDDNGSSECTPDIPNEFKSTSKDDNGSSECATDISNEFKSTSKDDNGSSECALDIPNESKDDSRDDDGLSECAPDISNGSKDDYRDNDGLSECALDKLKVFSESDTVPNPNDNFGLEEQINSGGSLLNDNSTEKIVSNNVPLEQDQPLPSLKSLLDSINGVHDNDQQPCQSPVEESLKRPFEGNESEHLSTSSIQTTIISNEKPTISGVENGNLLSMVNPVHRGEGESSFSVAAPVSGHITYSGPIAVSGSVSLRSDSSTTSTRSFAFPILQTEWNSSPVRMAKADRRRLQKHRGWRHGLLCCRF